MYSSLVNISMMLGVVQTVLSAAFHPYGQHHGDHVMDRADDDFVEIDLKVPYPFFGKTYSKFYVSIFMQFIS